MASTALQQIFGGGIEGAGKGIAAVVNAIKGRNPEDAAKLQELLTKHEDLIVSTTAELEKAKIDENVQLNQIAGQNIRAEQGSRYTAWARPSIIYCWIAVMMYNYIVCGIVGKAPLTLPDMFWEVSGIVVTGYVFTRTGQEIAKTVLGGQGGSLNMLGVKMDSKGD